MNKKVVSGETKKNDKREQKNIKFTKRMETIGKSIFYVVLLILVAILVLYKANLISDANAMKNIENMDAEAVKSVGEDIFISNAEIISIEDGTEAFDADDEPGNDSSPSNKIVRSFDKITYNVDLTMSVKSGHTSSEKGGTILVEASIPSSLAKLVKWDLNQMSWFEGEISEDGTSINGTYIMSDEQSATAGKQTLQFVLQVYGAKNNTEIIPSFKFSLEGNEESEKKELIAEKVRVSAIGKYNVKLQSDTTKSATINYEGENLNGKGYAFGFLLQLYNDNVEKGMKGLEYPEGDISFDIDFKLERTKENSEEFEDITDKCNILFWNYNEIESWQNKGEILGRDMITDSDIDIFPRGVDNGDRSYSVYNSGKLEISQEGSKLHVTVRDYAFDSNGEFPRYYKSYESDPNRPKWYGDNIGNFSSIVMELFIENNEETSYQDRDYRITIENTNFKVNTNLEEQQVITDDKIETDYLPINKGNKSFFIDFSVSKDELSQSGLMLLNGGRDGDAAFIKNNPFTVNLTQHTSTSTDPEYRLINEDIIYKFDGSGLEPAYDEINFWTSGSNAMKFNAYYLTKKDGTNWASLDEMNKTVSLDDFNVYKNKTDIPEGYICVGILFQSVDGGTFYGTYDNVKVEMKVKEDAKLNEAYAMTYAVKGWIKEDNFDRTIYNVENEEISALDYPKASYERGGQDYRKTEYNEDVTSYKRHSSYYDGNTVLAVGAYLHGDIKAIDSENNIKESYDLGKNEGTVTYSVEPIIDKNPLIEEQITNITIKNKVTLPVGLEYVPGSSRKEGEKYDEPIKTENADGTTTLEWYIYGCASGTEVSPITFEAKIVPDTKTETRLDVKYVVSEEMGNEDAKLGNALVKYRESTSQIIVINLANHKLYQETLTPIIENDKEITYKITYQNNSEEPAEDFQVLDILPFNGDGRGTNYNGTYTLKNVKVTQKTNGNPISNDNLELFTTTDLDAREISPKEPTIGTSSIWTNKEIGEEVNEPVTVIALKGEVEAGTVVEIEITLKTENNNGGDKYYNVATAQVREDTDVITAINVKAEVVARQISGNIWYDENENGIKDDEESFASGIEVELLKSDGTKATNTNGNEIANQLTDVNGEYAFINLPKNNYKVRIITDNKYKLTISNVGTNKEINSKFEEKDGNKESYVITSLNSIESTEIVEKNVNAGLVIKDAKIIVNYLEEDETPNNDEDNNKLMNSKEITQYEKDGVETKYKIGDSYVTQAEDIENYIMLRNSGNVMGTIDSEVVEVTYYYTYNKTDITVQKVWNDNNDEAQKRPTSIKIELKDGSNIVKEVVLSDDNKSSLDENIWETTIKNLDIYKENGEKIAYTVDERENEGTLDTYNKTIEGYTITNTFSQNTKKINIPVTKIWDDNEDFAGKRPKEITLVLKREISNGNENEYQEVTRETINALDNIGENTNEWVYTFNNIPKYDQYNNEINYIVEEIEPSFYTSLVKRDESDGLKFNITNTFSVPDERINIPVTKIWDDNDNRARKRPTKVTLVLTGKNLEGDVIEKERRVTLTSSNAIEENSNIWKATISDLPKYDEIGNEIIYELSEENMDSLFYVESINQATKTITNKFMVPNATIDVEVSKIWDDDDNKENVRPESVTLFLSGNSQEYSIVLTKDNETELNGNVWKNTISNIPKYNVNGDEIEYILDERPVDSIFYRKTDVNQQNKTVTNEFSIPTESVQIPATKVWGDNNNALRKRPQVIELQIINKETKEVVETQIMHGNNNTNEGWSYIFEVPKYGATTEEIEYEIGEKQIDSELYTTSINQDTRTITNTFEIPDEKISVNVNKEWIDTPEQQDKRPESVTQLNPSNEWKETFTGLDKYDDYGNEINYIVEELSTNQFYKYTRTIGDMKSGYTITNTFEVPDEEISVNVNKEWIDTPEQQDKRPESVTVIIKNGNTAKNG